MAAKFGAKSTTEDVLAGVDLKGKRILVTGVSAGLGVETARALVAHRADVVGAARDLEKAQQATLEVSKAAGKVEFDHLETRAGLHAAWRAHAPLRTNWLPIAACSM